MERKKIQYLRRGSDNMIRIAICDDEQPICNSLNDIIEIYMKTKGIAYDVEIFESAERLVKYIKGGESFDIIFLDIEMRALNGIEFGEIVRNEMEDELTKIIFISWQTAYALDLFKVRPVDFIVKPLSEERIFEVLNITCKLLCFEEEYFEYRTGYEYGRLRLADVIYFRILNRKVMMCTADESVEFYAKLEDVISECNKEYFWRIHKSYVINYFHIKKLNYKGVTMINGETLPISQKYRAIIRKNQQDMMK